MCDLFTYKCSQMWFYDGACTVIYGCERMLLGFVLGGFERNRRGVWKYRGGVGVFLFVKNLGGAGGLS